MDQKYITSGSLTCAHTFKEYKYHGNLWLIIPAILIFLLGLVIIDLAHKNNTQLILDGIEFNVEATTVLFAILGAGSILIFFLMILSIYFGHKIKRNIVLEGDRMIFPKNNFSAERIVKKYSEISSVSQVKVNGQDIVKITYIDGTKREFVRILFASKEEFLDFVTNLTHLIAD